MRTTLITMLTIVCARSLQDRRHSARRDGRRRAVTFHKDVEPILQKRCQSCHRPGEMAPMSLLTYQDARPWAKAIRAAVLQKTMPPWFAEPAHGEFANDRTLAPSEIDTLVRWVESRRTRGRSERRARADAVRRRVDHRQARRHFEIPMAFKVPATGTSRTSTSLAHRVHRGQMGRKSKCGRRTGGRPPHQRLGVRRQAAKGQRPGSFFDRESGATRNAEAAAVLQRRHLARCSRSMCPEATRRC